MSAKQEYKNAYQVIRLMEHIRYANAETDYTLYDGFGAPRDEINASGQTFSEWCDAIDQEEYSQMNFANECQTKVDALNVDGRLIAIAFQHRYDKKYARNKYPLHLFQNRANYAIFLKKNPQFKRI